MSRPRIVLGLVLAGSLALRLVLAAGGGQYFWDDEVMRYGREVHSAAHHLLAGEWPELARELFGHPDHAFFRWVALPAALLQLRLGAGTFAAAAYFALISTLVIWLGWCVARRAGAGEREAGWAALLAAASTSLFYFSRHFVPYDAALALVLASPAVALGADAGRGRALLAGALAGLGFLTYNGYWLPGAGVLALVVWSAEGWRARAGRAAWVGAGAVLPLALLGFGGWRLGFDLPALYRGMAASVTQGDFGQGWRVLLEYLWHTEHVVVLGWLVAAGFAGWLVARGAAIERRAWWWLGVAGFVVAGLVGLSDLLPRFVVYGRLVRPLAPFGCLLAAWALERVFRHPRSPAWLPAVLAAGLLVVAAANFAIPLRQVFPADFRPQAMAVARSRPYPGPGAWQIWNTESLRDGLLGLSATRPPHAVRWSRPHPLQFRPYQYEGFTAVERQALNQPDRITLQLVELLDARGAPLRFEPGEMAKPDGLGPVRLVVRFPRGRTGHTEPLVTSGVPGAGSFLFVTYVDATHVNLGFDNWGTGGPVFGPVEVDFGAAHELILSHGGLQPLTVATPAVPRDWLEIRINGRLLGAQVAAAHPAPPGTIFIGANFIGGSTAGMTFTGVIERLERAAPTPVRGAQAFP